MPGACEYKTYSNKPRQIIVAQEEGQSKQINTIRLATIAAVLVFVSWLHILQPIWIANIVTVATVIVGGYPIYKQSFSALKKGRVNMELSMAIAIIASLILSQYLPAIVITFFALLSEFVEGFIVKKGRRNIRMLYDLVPRRAIIKNDKQDGSLQTTPVNIDKVNVGDIVIVREGDIIPVDGHIVTGFSMVDQSSITGESMPVEKNKGELVFAGTINQTRQLEVKCEKASTDTTFAKIIQLIEDVEVSKAPIQKLSDKMAARLIQFAIGLSILTYFITHDIISTLSVIVVAGACGLAVGTPIALLATTGNLSKRGIIVKGGIQIENLRNAKIAVFDKTGTLTYGKPIVSEVISFSSSIEPMKILEYAAIAENNINHPLAKAVEEMARQRNIAIGGLNNSNDNLVTVGKGVTRIYNGRKISVGNLKFMEQEIMLTQNSISGLQVYGLLVKGKNYHQHFVGRGGQDNNTGQMLQTRNKDSIGNKSHDYIFAFTTAFVALDKQVIGAVLFEDTLRKEAKEAVTKLKSMGVRVIMLTGDNEEIAKRIAHHAGINEYYANLLPLNKVLKIEEIVNEEKKGKSKTVIMIGDGINDAPALAKADVGMAMGRTGTDMAIETADVILMTEDLTKIPYLLRKSRQALWTVQQNFYGTLFIDGLGFVLAFAGMLNPLSAVIIHVSSELIFMINSARLLIHT